MLPILGVSCSHAATHLQRVRRLRALRERGHIAPDAAGPLGDLPYRPRPAPPLPLTGRRSPKVLPMAPSR